MLLANGWVVPCGDRPTRYRAPVAASDQKRVGMIDSFLYVVATWRLGAVSLLSISSGLPLGLILTGIPAWMTDEKVDIKTIGVITMAQAPYGLKFLWSPMMD